MKEASLNLKYLHAYRGTVSNDFWNAVGKDGDDVLCDGFWSEDWPFPRAKEIGERYFKQFDKRSTVGYYYALCQTLWQAIEKAGTLDGAKVRDTVLTTQFKGTIMEMSSMDLMERQFFQRVFCSGGTESARPFIHLI